MAPVMRPILTALVLATSLSLAGLACADPSEGVPAPPQPSEVTSAPAVIYDRAVAFASDSYQREPQLMTVAVAAAILLPLLSLGGLAVAFGSRFRARPAVGEAGATAPRTAMASFRLPTSVEPVEKRAEPLLDIIGDNELSHPLNGSMLRIGRHEENDIRLASQTVHRYHAVVHATPDNSYVITDLSGPEGNGVLVNSERVDQATLASGDLIELGDVRMRFRMAS